jgi:hypothetical protein
MLLAAFTNSGDGTVLIRSGLRYRLGNDSSQARSSSEIPLRSRRQIVCLLGLLLTAEASVLPFVASLATDAWAQSRSSGGYSRPGASYSRTPSFSASRPAPRTPSTSGGYARPSPSTRPSVTLPWSSGDQAVSRQRSSQALGAWRAQQDTARRAAQAPPATADRLPPSQSGGFSRTPAAPEQRVRPAERPGWYAQRGWNAPLGYAGPQRSFGMWDGLFLGFLLSNLTRPGSTDFFHNHRDDPGYLQWREQVDRQARDNAELRSRLDALDQQLAARSDQPRDPAYLPPDVPATVAVAPDAPARTPSLADADGGDGIPWTFIAVLAGGAVIGWMIWSRRRRVTEAGGSGMDPLSSAARMLRNKLSGEKYVPDRFRVGMVMSFDPAPFILAAGATKVPAPSPDAGSTRISIEAVGHVRFGEGTQLVRLYLPGQRGMFQLHLDPGGNPDECRFFAMIDEVAPADPNEWAVWLHPAEGLIGWPQFQTKDGKLYDRIWTPSAGRVPPLRLRETIETTSGTSTVDSQAMLYAAPTGLADPAPRTEYILVAAVEAGGRASVEIAAGIDVNPAMLSLA